MWQQWALDHGFMNYSAIIQYNNDRYQKEYTRWLPDLAKVDQEGVIPIHLCWGEEDDVAPSRVARYLKKEICKNATVTFLKNTGHFLEQESAGEVARQCLCHSKDVCLVGLTSP